MSRLLVILFLSYSITYAQSSLSTLTTEQWIHDIRELKLQIEKNHIDPFNHISKATWDKKFQGLESELPKLSYQQIVTRLIALAASVGDGHTNARPYEALSRYPITMQWFGDELRIIRIAHDKKEALGARVLKIGNLKIMEAHEKMKQLIPMHESPTFVLGWSEYLLSFDEILVGAGVKKAGPLSLLVKQDNGKELLVTLLAPSKSDKVEQEWVYNPLPLYLSKSEQSPYYEWLPGANKVLYFNFERYPEWDKMRAFGMGLIQLIKGNEVDKLIVDVRENGGGDFKKGMRLIEELQKTYLNTLGKVYVIIGRNTFSAGMSNAAHFKTMLKATLVGETTGARPVGYQENYGFTLSNSQIPASCATKHYEFLDKDTDGIIPDVEILPDFHLYKKGRDAAIEWIVRQ